MENVQIRAESFEKQYYVGAWEKETERQIRMYLSESGIPGAAVSVTLEPGNTGEAKEIRIEAPMRQTSIYREEQKKQRELLDEKLTEIVRTHFDLRPAGIIKMLDLRRPIYKQTAAYGHFGRNDLDLPWERLDKVEELKKYL